MSEKRQKSINKKNKLLAQEEIVQYVYIMYDKDNNVVYIGQTENMDRRMKSHCIFIPEEEIYSSVCNRSTNTIIPEEHLSDIKRVKYAELPNKYLSSIYEIQLIAKYRPIYNTQFKYYTKKLLDLPNLKWDYYIPYNSYENLSFCAEIKYRLIPSKELNKMAKNFKTRKQAMENLSKLISQERENNK